MQNSFNFNGLVAIFRAGPACPLFNVPPRREAQQLKELLALSTNEC